MHYLTRIKLDTNNRKTQLALGNPSIFHGAIEESLGYGEGRNLWRIDTVGGSKFLLISSEDIPGTESIVDQFGEDVPANTKEYGSYINGISNGELMRFRLEANPVYTYVDENGKKHKLAHTTTDHQLKWLERQAGKFGFGIVSSDIKSVSRYSFPHEKTSRPITFVSVVYEGILEVADSDILKKALVNGIGKNKAFGMGMLTVSRIRG